MPRKERNDRAFPYNLFQDDIFAAQDDRTKCVMIGLILQTDDQGVVDYRPLELAIKIRMGNVDELVEGIAFLWKADLVRGYEEGRRIYDWQDFNTSLIDKRSYLHFRKQLKYQHFDKRKDRLLVLYPTPPADMFDTADEIADFIELFHRTPPVAQIEGKGSASRATARKSARAPETLRANARNRAQKCACSGDPARKCAPDLIRSDLIRSEVQNTPRTTSTDDPESDAVLPKAPASVSKSPSASTIKDPSRNTASDLIDELLTHFEPCDYNIVRYYVTMCLPPTKRQRFQNDGWLDDTSRMCEVLTQLIELVKRLLGSDPVQYKWQPVNVGSYSALLEFMYGAAHDAQAMLEKQHGFLKSRIQLGVRKRIPESMFRHQETQQSEEQPDHRITNAQCDLIQTLADERNTPIRRTDAYAREHFGADNHLVLNADEAQDLIRWLEQLPAMSHEDIIESLPDGALEQPINTDYLFDDDFQKKVGLPKWVRDGLHSTGNLKYNLRNLTLAELLSLKDADKKSLCRAASPVQWREARGRSPPK